MSFKTIAILIAVLTVSAGQLYAADDTFTDWHGTYKYRGTGGHTAGGSPIWLDATLKISTSGECKITEDGFQLHRIIICSAHKDENRLDVRFKSYPGGKTKNENGITVYNSNERLLSLIIKGKNKSIYTEWGRLQPSFENSKTGIFFIKHTN